MTGAIDYFLTVVSPWAFLGHRALVEMAARHDVDINFRPVALGPVWENSGSVPLGQRSPLRQRYRLIELQRYRELRGVDLKLHPAFFPVDTGLADLSICAIVGRGADPAEFAGRCGAAIWTQDRNIADEAVVAELLQEAGHDAQTIITEARGPAASEMRRANIAAAIEADATGVPSYVYKGEVFWGQDRIDMLERMIVSGREAFHAD